MKSLALLITLLFSVFIFGQNRAQSIEEIVQFHHLNNEFEGVVLAVENGETIYQNAFGFADRKLNIPLSIDTKFGIASFTKAFTALIIMQLEEEGKLNVDDEVMKYLPDLDMKNLEKVRIKHLLTHSSGLGNEPDVAYIQRLTPREMLLSYANKKIKSTPGEGFNYSNLDFLALSLIIEKVTQKTWEINLNDRILKPLKMINSGVLTFEKKPKKLTKTYSKKEGKFIEDGNFYIENFDAAGAMYSTLEDLLKFDQALYGNDLLSDAQISKMYTSHPELSYVAYGSWAYNHPFIEGYPLTIERRGGIAGFNGVFMRFPEAKKTLIVLSNNGEFNTDTWGDMMSLKEQLIKALFDEEVKLK